MGSTWRICCFFCEYSKEITDWDTPYYPKRLEQDIAKPLLYRELAANETGISFFGAPWRLPIHEYGSDNWRGDGFCTCSRRSCAFEAAPPHLIQ